MSAVADNLRDIEDRIAQAVARSGRRPDSVRLVAVTKTQPVAAIREAIAAGVREIGENYVQEAATKFGELFAASEPANGVRHLIGPLQRNKAGKAAALFDVVQSLDSLRLAEALGRRAVMLGRILEVLIEVNISGQPARCGALPEQARDLAQAVAAVPGLRLIGLMGIGPLGVDEAAVAASFAGLRRLYEDLPPANRQVLSMGMSGDFERAIAEGSTMVRIGTGIFGPRRRSG